MSLKHHITMTMLSQPVLQFVLAYKRMIIIVMKSKHLNRENIKRGLSNEERSIMMSIVIFRELACY